MITVRKQEFIESFLYGIILLLIGITGCILNNHIYDNLSFILMILYSTYKFILRNKKREEDDELSEQSKAKASNLVFLGLLIILYIITIIIYLSEVLLHSISITLTLNINTLFIILGILHIAYYLAFMYFERCE